MLIESYKFGSLSQRTMLVDIPVLAIEETVTFKVGLVTEAGQPVASNKLTTEYVVLVPGVKVIGPNHLFEIQNHQFGSLTLDAIIYY